MLGDFAVPLQNQWPLRKKYNRTTAVFNHATLPLTPKRPRINRGRQLARYETPHQTSLSQEMNATLSVGNTHNNGCQQKRKMKRGTARPLSSSPPSYLAGSHTTTIECLPRATRNACPSTVRLNPTSAPRLCPSVYVTTAKGERGPYVGPSSCSDYTTQQLTIVQR